MRAWREDYVLFLVRRYGLIALELCWIQVRPLRPDRRDGIWYWEVSRRAAGFMCTSFLCFISHYPIEGVGYSWAMMGYRYTDIRWASKLTQGGGSTEEAHGLREGSPFQITWRIQPPFLAHTAGTFLYLMHADLRHSCEVMGRATYAYMYAWLCMCVRLGLHVPFGICSEFNSCLLVDCSLQ